MSSTCTQAPGHLNPDTLYVCPGLGYVGSIEVLFHFRTVLPGGFDIVNASVHSAPTGSFVRVSMLV